VQLTIDEYRKRLGREVRHLMTRIAELQQVNITQQRWRVQGDEIFLELQEDIQNVLVDLGESMVQSGAIPEAAHSSISSPTLRDHDDLYSASPVGERHQHSQTQPSRKLRHTGSPIGLQHTISHSRESSRRPHNSGPRPGTNTVGAVRSREVRLNQEPPQSQAVIPPSASKPKIEEVRVSNTLHPSPVSPQEGDFISVTPISYVLHLSQDSVMEAVSGYINTSNGRMSTTALLDKSLDQNIISAAFATKNTLIIQAHDEKDEGTEIDFGNGKKERSLGTVTLEWSQSMYEGGVRIHCLVYEHNIRDLVFGKPFVVKTRHYGHGAGTSG
jgi:hypothetical protein